MMCVGAPVRADACVVEPSPHGTCRTREHARSLACPTGAVAGDGSPAHARAHTPLQRVVHARTLAARAGMAMAMRRAATQLVCVIVQAHPVSPESGMTPGSIVSSQSTSPSVIPGAMLRFDSVPCLVMRGRKPDFLHSPAGDGANSLEIARTLPNPSFDRDDVKLGSEVFRAAAAGAKVVMPCPPSTASSLSGTPSPYNPMVSDFLMKELLPLLLRESMPDMARCLQYAQSA